MLAGLGLALVTNASPVLKVLFLGDNGHHRPSERLRELAPAMMARGIQLVYTEDLAAITSQNLKRYDGLLIYANIESLPAAQGEALLSYVTEGGGLFALHCASACFRNSPRYVALVGAQFKSHQTGTFRTTLVDPENPIVKGFAGFESWDETYVHTAHNEKGRTVLEMRDNEPWTWTRLEGKGRVFYTAWGHDERTWTNPGFHDLVERGIRFVAGQKLPDALLDRPKVAGFELIDQPGVAYYPPGQRSEGDGAWPQMPKPLTPEQSMQHLVVPAGFEVQLVASDPEIKKPIAMNWDERGRLWIAETLDYPNTILPRGTPGRDRIVICEDTNGDGRADKFTVFAEGLNIPTSLTFANGGVIVHQMPETLFFKDTDGDDKADVKEVLFTGWGRRDTHAGPSNLQYGLDNWIWGIVGYSGFDGSVAGVAQKFDQAFYRFRPDGSALEYVRSNNNNSWGLGFTEEGYVFGSTANNNPSVFVPIPNRFYGPAGLQSKVLPPIADSSRYLPLTARVRQVDVHWGYTAAAGHAFYTARSYPREYWNRTAFVTEPTGHLVGQFNIKSAGAGFRSVNPTNLLSSDDEWCAPIMAEVGPDGAVWVIDWYNYIVQHNPTPKGFKKGEGNAYETELRDKRYGRIYRIVWKGDGAKPAPILNLKTATPAQLVETLRNDNLFWRRHAQRLLVERGRKDVVPALIALVADQQKDELDLNVGAIHALWTLHGLNAIDAMSEVLEAVKGAVRHPSAGVRRAALDVLPHTAATGTVIREAGLLNDPDAQVRLGALLALSQVPASAAVADALHAFLTKPGAALDRLTVEGATIAASAHAKFFVEACSPEETAATMELRNKRTSPETVVDAFESISGGLGAWSVGKEANPAAAVSVVGEGRHGGHCLEVKLTNAGEARVTRKMAVKPNTRYLLTGYIKTADIKTSPNARGAFITVPEIQQPRPAISVGITGSTTWALVRTPFETNALQEVSIVCGVGGGGSGAAGVAWFDDLVLTDLGATDEIVAFPVGAVLEHVLSKTQGRGSVSADVTAGLPKLELGVVPDLMKYDRPEVTAKAGQQVQVIFKNKDHMQHNAVIIRPGTLEKVGALADALLTNPEAVARNYVPDSNDVLFSTPLVDPGETYTVVFNVPEEPGRYPIICSFPGHWRLMQATLIVTN